MSSSAHETHYTYADYLVLESSSNVKHEFLAGQIYAMAGGTPEHGALAAAITGILFAQLRGGQCRPYNSDVRVRTPSGLATYPDVSVICGQSARDAEDQHAITNPTVIFEVLSRSTEEYDRSDKFEHYKSIDSLVQYVLVSQERRRIEVWTRRENGVWAPTIADEGDVAELAIGARLDVRELYDSAAE
jgi:Uma2 family endonuclease